MLFFIDHRKNTPIYDQLKTQIIQQILSGQLLPHQQMGSIRMVAQSLGVGIITVKRAYEDLIAAGFLYSQPGKGVFVEAYDATKYLSQMSDQARTKIQQIIQHYLSMGISKESIKDILNTLEENDYESS